MFHIGSDFSDKVIYIVPFSAPKQKENSSCNACRIFLISLLDCLRNWAFSTCCFGSLFDLYGVIWQLCLSNATNSRKGALQLDMTTLTQTFIPQPFSTQTRLIAGPSRHRPVWM